MTSIYSLIGQLNAAVVTASALVERHKADGKWMLAADCDRIATDAAKLAHEAMQIAKRQQSQEDRQAIEDVAYRAPELLKGATHV